MANTYLSKTFSGTPTNSRKCTFSAWFKRSKVGSEQVLISWSTASNRDGFRFDGTSDKLRLFINGASEADIITNKLFRDTSGWYHVVFAVDTTQSTASNRIKLYINGVQETSLSSSSYPSQNHDLGLGSARACNIGRDVNDSNAWFDGCMSHVHFVDGSQLAPTVFGSTDSTTGEWKINTSPSYTVGTNGFFVLKDGNSGTDQSANSNNFTVGGGTLTKTEDCPSNVFATGNNLATYWTAATFANGNTTQTTQSNNYAFNTSTLGFKTGKFYWEAKIVSSAQSDMFGITGRTNAGATTNELGKYSDQYAFNSYSGVSRNNSTDTSYTSQFNSNGTIVQIAVDMTNLKIHLGVNGVWQNSSNPSNNTGGLAIGAISTTKDGFYFVGIGDYSNSAGTHSYNFGNGYFGTTAVSSAGANASGIGIFEYDVPTGFTALSTKGLNL
tara:strand:- start:1 stop:1323 length:1323 start_codon:yes stop_codon:yes gene_type:complete